MPVVVKPVVTDDPTIAHCSFIHMAEFFRECVAWVAVGSETGAEYTESSDVVMGSTGRGHPTQTENVHVQFDLHSYLVHCLQHGN